MSNPAPPAASPPAEPYWRKVSPWAAFFGRETGQIVHGRGYAWRRVTYLVMGLLLIIIVGFGNAKRMRAGGGPAFDALMLLNVYLLFFLTSSFFSKAVSGEREAGSLDLLRITGLSPLALLVGKGTSQFVHAVLLLVMQLPLAA